MLHSNWEQFSFQPVLHGAARATQSHLFHPLTIHSSIHLQHIHIQLTICSYHRHMHYIYIYIIKGTLVTVWMDCDFWRTYWIFVLMSVLTDYFLSADLYWRMVGVFCTDVFFYFLQLVDCLHRCIFPQLYAKLCNIISVNQSNGIWQIHVIYSKSKCLT